MKTTLLILTLAICNIVNAQFITANFFGPDSGCAPICTNFYDQSTSNNGPIVSWQWAFPGGSPSSSTVKNPQNICYFSPGAYNVQLIVTNSNGNKDTATFIGYVKVYSWPTANAGSSVTINAGGSTTLNATGGGTYVWYPGGSSTSSIIVSPTITSLYCVTVRNAFGCYDSACVTVFVGVLGVHSFSYTELTSVYPNPLLSNTTFKFSAEQRNVRLKFFSLLGEEVRNVNFSGKQFTLERETLPGGTYFYQIISPSAEILTTGKLIIQ